LGGLCLKYHVTILLLITLVFFVIFTGDTTNELGQSSKIDSPPSVDQEEWNQSTIDNPSFGIQSLYDLEKVPQLNKLLVNATFIRQVYMYRIPYFLGYSGDGRYAAIISYEEEKGDGYFIKIYDTLVGEIIYSAFVPNTERVLETEEFKLAQEALENGFNINTLPIKLNWKNEMRYKTDNATWMFQQDQHRDRTNFMIKQLETQVDAKDKQDLEWLLLTEEHLNKKEKYTYIELFQYPNHPTWVTMVHVHLNEEQGTLHDYTPTFIRLDHLTKQNSLIGSKAEADMWLYGQFQFIYDQGETGVRKGYLAVSTEDEKELKQKEYLDSIEQWIYLDPTGKMIWYGNPQGVFNSETEASQSSEYIYFYRIHLIKDPISHSLQYFVIDQINQKTHKLNRTLEFKWNKQKLQMVPF